MKSKVLGRHQKILSAKPKIYELSPHPGRPEGDGRKWRTHVWLACCSAFMSACVSCQRNPNLANTQPGRIAHEGDRARKESEQTLPFGECTSCLCWVFYMHFSLIFIITENSHCHISVVITFLQTRQPWHRDVAAFPGSRDSHNRIMFTSKVVLFPQNHPASMLHKAIWDVIIPWN